MLFERNDLEPQSTERWTGPGRQLIGGIALALLLAGSLAFATPTFAQDDTTAEPTAAAGESTGTMIEAGTTDTATGTDAAAAPADTAAAPADTAGAAADTAAAPAAPAAGSGTTATALPNTGVGEAATGPLTLIALVGAGAVAAGAVAVNRARPAVRRAERRF
jgi:hypothetical protein